MKKTKKQKLLAGKKLGKKNKTFKKERIIKAKSKYSKKTKKPQIKKISLKENKKQLQDQTKEVIQEKQNIIFSSDSLFKAKIRVIGVGGGGGSIVSEIGRTLEKATFLIADTDIRALKKRNGIKHFWFGENLTHGLGTGVNVEIAQQAAQESKEKFKEFFDSQDIVIFIASLGGGLGSGATQIFIDAAKEFNGITLGIFTLPFKFEGKNKSRVALNALKELKQSLNVSLVIPNEKIFKVIDENTPITEAFSMVNKNLAESLESLINLIYNPGIINIDFADLKAILKGKGNQAFLNTIEESGKDRAEKICEKIFTNPLLQNHGFEANNILFNVAGSENLSMFEVEKISRHISELNSQAKIIFGISKDIKLKSKIKTTILMTGSGMKEATHKEEITATKTILEKQKLKKSKVAKIIKSKNKLKPQKEKINNENEIDLNKDINKAVKDIIELTPKKMQIIDAALSVDLNKKAIRRTGIDIKKSQEQEEKKKEDQEKEWEIPAFLRRVKYRS